MTKAQLNDLQVFLTFQFTDELRLKVQDKVQILLDNHQLTMFKTCILFNMQGSLLNPIGLFDVKQQLNPFNKAKIQCMGQFIKLLFTVRKNYEVQTKGQQDSQKHIEVYISNIYELIKQTYQELIQSDLTIPLEQIEKASDHFVLPMKKQKEIKVPQLKDCSILEGMIQQLPNHYARAQVLAEYFSEQGIEIQGNSNLTFDIDFTTFSPNEFYALYNICLKYFPDGQVSKIKKDS